MDSQQDATRVTTCAEWIPSAVDRRLAQQVRMRREALRLSHAGLAGCLGVAPSAVAEMEAGARQRSGANLVALSRSLGASIEELIGVHESPEHVEDCGSTAPRFGDASPLHFGELRYLCEAYRFLERELGEERRVEPHAPGVQLDSVEEAFADEARGRLGLAFAPAGMLLSVLEERVGVKVFSLDLDRTLAGGSVVNSRHGAVIVVNRRRCAGRQAFTLAHQYFHLLERGNMVRPSGSRWCYAYRSQPSGDPAGNERETLADRFALRLLIASTHVLARIGEHVRRSEPLGRAELLSVAREFGVCVTDMVEQLALLDFGRCCVGSRDDSTCGVGAESECAVEPQRFRRLAIRAYLSERISVGKLAELLEVDVVDIGFVFDKQFRIT
jgi:Zn-dependent peptidase ImmA (M78 family)